MLLFTALLCHGDDNDGHDHVCHGDGDNNDGDHDHNENLSGNEIAKCLDSRDNNVECMSEKSDIFRNRN